MGFLHPASFTPPLFSKKLLHNYQRVDPRVATYTFNISNSGNFFSGKLPFPDPCSFRKESFEKNSLYGAMLTGINHCEKALVKKDKKEAIMYKAEHVFSKANNII